MRLRKFLAGWTALLFAGFGAGAAIAWVADGPASSQLAVATRVPLPKDLSIASQTPLPQCRNYRPSTCLC